MTLAGQQQQQQQQHHHHHHHHQQQQQQHHHHQQQQQTVIAATEAYVCAELAQHDASHSFDHVERVRRLALRLGRSEGLTADELFEVELAALLHDVGDHKYSKQPVAAGAMIASFLQTQQQPPDVIARVVAIVERVGFKEELAGGNSSSSGGAQQLSTAAAVVQDADRLDAIGAVGIARCFTFGGAKGCRVLHDPAIPPRTALTKAAYMQTSSSGGGGKAGQQTTTLNHFYEKLLTLKGRMKTASGARLAQARHDYMEGFVKQFLQEWDCADAEAA